MKQQHEDGDGDGDKPLTLNRSEQSYNKLMKSPREATDDADTKYKYGPENEGGIIE